MTTQLIPTGADAFSQQTTTLDGVPYLLTFAFNQRGAYWKVSVATIDGVSIAAGLKLVVNWDLLRKCASPNRPPGALLVISNTSDLSPPGLLDLTSADDGGTGRCLLGYLPEADVLALREGTS